jgi:hypothetical protein
MLVCPMPPEGGWGVWCLSGGALPTPAKGGGFAGIVNPALEHVESRVGWAPGHEKALRRGLRHDLYPTVRGQRHVAKAPSCWEGCRG